MEIWTIEKLRHLHIGNAPLRIGRDSSLMEPKRKSLASKQRFEAEEMTNGRYGHGHDRDEDEEEEEEYEEKTSFTRNTTPRSRRSRGVSTDDIEEIFKPPKPNSTAEFSPETNSLSSPPSTTSSATPSEKSNHDAAAGVSKGFEEVGNEPLLSINSMLLSLIACGGSASFRKAAPPEAARRSGGSLHKGVVILIRPIIVHYAYFLNCFIYNLIFCVVRLFAKLQLKWPGTWTRM